jgi:hypothetical protein
VQERLKIEIYGGNVSVGASAAGLSQAVKERAIVSQRPHFENLKHTQTAASWQHADVADHRIGGGLPLSASWSPPLCSLCFVPLLPVASHFPPPFCPPSESPLRHLLASSPPHPRRYASSFLPASLFALVFSAAVQSKPFYCRLQPKPRAASFLALLSTLPLQADADAACCPSVMAHGVLLLKSYFPPSRSCSVISLLMSPDCSTITPLFPPGSPELIRLRTALSPYQHSCTLCLCLLYSR